MLNVPINAALKEAVSEKSGKTYYYIEIQLTADCIKKVFPEPAELELLKLAYGKKQA